MLRWTLSLHLESRQPSMEDQTRQDQKALEEAGIEKTELSADRAPSKAYLSEENASLALQKGFVDDSGLSCAPVAKHRMLPSQRSRRTPATGSLSPGPNWTC